MSKKSTKSGKKKNNLPYSEKKLIEQQKEINKKKAEKKEKITRIVIPAVALLIVAALVALIVILSTREQPKSDESSVAESSSAQSSENSEVSEMSAAEETKQELDISPSHVAEIDIKDYGTIKLELFSDAAPITVANFEKLANDGFYNGLTFHRIMEGFMMQGGDPNGNGSGGSGENIKGEFSANGWENPISHLRGVISMARKASDMDSASSQFFIVQKDHTEDLDGIYAAFGRVTEGMDIVDRICEEAEPTDSNGTIPQDKQPVINSITVTPVSSTETSEETEPTDGESEVLVASDEVAMVDDVVSEEITE